MLRQSREAFACEPIAQIELAPDFSQSWGHPTLAQNIRGDMAALKRKSIWYDH
jgi:hypothetical protein